MKLTAHSALSFILAGSFLFLGACGKEGSSEDPFVLGTPPAIAYLGVEYEYNFGGAGGDRPLDYSIGAAPDWFALEFINNTARQGVIGRGVPGITGGRRGIADLGQTKNIKVTVNDGNKLGSNTFGIEVKDNLLKLSNVTVMEGQPSDLSGEGIDDTNKNCSLPDVATVGSLNGLPTHRVVIPITLTHPSVEKVRVRYKFTSKYISTSSETALGNRDAANHDQKGIEDFASQVSVIDSLSSTGFSEKKPPNYLETSNKGGVVTFKAGATRCYIVAEVVDDIRAELDETFQVELDQVIEGLASFSANGAVKTADVLIKDNEPKVSFVSQGGIINEGVTKHYYAKLDKTVDRKIVVNIVSSKEVTKSSGSSPGLKIDDFSLTNSFYNESTNTRTYSKSSPTVNPGDASSKIPAALATLEFAPNTDTVDFYLRIEKNSDGVHKNDEKLYLGFNFDVNNNSARTPISSKRILENGDVMKISINEWTKNIFLPAQPNSSVNDMALDIEHNLIIAQTISGALPSDGKTTGLIQYYDTRGVKKDHFAADGKNDLIGSTGEEKIQALKVASRKSDDVAGDSKNLSNVVFIGTTTGDLSSANSGKKDIFIASYRRIIDPDVASASDKLYTKMWLKQLGSDQDDIPTAVAIGPAGKVYVAGTTNGLLPLGLSQKSGMKDGQATEATVDINAQIGGKDAFLAVYDKDGSLLWAKNFGTVKDDDVSSIDVQNGSTIFISGTTHGAFEGKTNAGGIDGFRVKFSADGKLESAEQFGTASDDIVVGAENIGSTVIMAGHTSGDLTLITTDSKKSIDQSLSSLTSQDVFLLKTDTVGNLNGTFQYGGAGTEKASAFDVNTKLAFLAAVTDTELVTGSGVDGEDFVISAIDPNSSSVMSTSWQVQKSLVGNQAVVDLDAGDEGKLFVLFSNDDLTGSGKSYSIGLFDEANGSDLLTQESDANIPVF